MGESERDEGRCEVVVNGERCVRDAGHSTLCWLASQWDDLPDAEVEGSVLPSERRNVAPRILADRAAKASRLETPAPEAAWVCGPCKRGNHGAYGDQTVKCMSNAGNPRGCACPTCGPLAPPVPASAVEAREVPTSRDVGHLECDLTSAAEWQAAGYPEDVGAYFGRGDGSLSAAQTLDERIAIAQLVASCRLPVPRPRRPVTYSRMRCLGEGWR